MDPKEEECIENMLCLSWRNLLRLEEFSSASWEDKCSFVTSLGKLKKKEEQKIIILR